MDSKEQETKEKDRDATARPTYQPTVKDPDKAYQFLTSIGAAHDIPSDIDIKRLRRKVDRHIVPIMFLCYTMQFIDKVSLNYAAVMGLVKDCKLKGNDFSNAATAFFIAYLVAEVPTGYILNKVPVGKWLGGNVVLWGIATACTAAAHDYSSLLAARIFLGIFEAAIAPCLMLISSQWYTKSEQAPRFSFWYCGLGIGQILGGIVSYGFQHVDTSFAGWRIMFVFLGVLTVLIGFITLVFLPDTPMTARFLSDPEKAAILHHTSSNRTGVSTLRFKRDQILEAFVDPQIYLLTLTTILISISSGVVTTYSATLIKNIGYKPTTAALLNMPSGLVSLFFTILVGIGVRKKSHRWAWLAACCIPGILGGALLSFLPSSKGRANKAGLLAGIYLVNAVVATLIVIYQWTASNVAGHTKRVFAMALISGSFSVGNIIGPQTFKARDAPQFIPAKITVLATQGAGAVVAFVLFGYYRRENSKRDREAREMQAAGEVLGVRGGKSKWENLTDKERHDFRYVY